MYSLPAFPITGQGQKINIPLLDPNIVPGATQNPVKAVVLINTSGFFLSATPGGTTVTQTIPPGMNDLVMLPGPSVSGEISVVVDPNNLGNHGQGSGPVQLSGNVYELNDSLPTGSYPMVNHAFTVTPPGAEVALVGGNYTIVAGGSVDVSIPVPNGIQTLMFEIDLLTPLPPLPTALEVQSAFDLSIDQPQFIPGISGQAFLGCEAGQYNDFFINNNNNVPVTINVDVYGYPFPYKLENLDHATWEYGGLFEKTATVTGFTTTQFLAATNNIDLSWRLHKMIVTPQSASTTSGYVACIDNMTPNNQYGVVLGTQGESDLKGTVANGTVTSGPISIKNNTGDAVVVTLLYDQVKFGVANPLF